ncbi:MAG: hypothetical protein OEV64_10440, partial [Desulfobulbaceae bacterium]|nr:hypothetical protein [Desulfobulbaceae bacterium]
LLSLTPIGETVAEAVFSRDGAEFFITTSKGLILRFTTASGPTIGPVLAALLAERDEELLARLADPATPSELALESFNTLKQYRLNILRDALRRHRLAQTPMPSPEQWDGLLDDERTHLACRVNIEGLDEVLRTETDPRRFGTQALLCAYRSRVDPDFGQAVEPVLRGRIPECGPSLHRPRGIGVLAGDAHALLLRNVLEARVPGRERPPVGLLAIWRDGVRRSLSRGLEYTLLNHLAAYWRIHHDWDFGPPVLGDLLVELMADRNNRWKVRFMARMALDGTMIPGKGEARSVTMERRKRANEMLVGIVTDPSEPSELRSLIREQLPRLYPEGVAELQTRTMEAKTPVPPWAEVRCAQLTKALDEISRKVDLDEVASLLTDASDAEPERVLTAIELVPAVLRWYPAMTTCFEPLLRARLKDERKVSPVSPHQSTTLAARALKSYENLLAVYGRAEAASLSPLQAGVIEEVLLVALRGGLRIYELALKIRSSFPREAAVAAPRVLALLQDAKLAPLIRFNAYMGHDALAPGENKILNQAAAMIIADFLEDMELRTLLIENYAYRLPKLLHTIRRKVKKSLLPLPPVEDLYYVSFEERGIPFGFELNTLKVNMAADITDPEEVLAILEQATDPSKTLAALHILPRLIQLEPQFLTRTVQALRPLTTDQRIHQWQYHPGGDYHKRLSIAQTAQRVLSELTEDTFISGR